MISIVTITYNDFEGLKRTLNSIPDYDFIESVIINGGSDISTLEYLKSRRGNAISEKDKGIADAFNKGFKNSSGDSIMFLNSGDELIDPIYLKSADDILRKNNKVDFVHSNILLIDSGGTELFMRPALCNLGRGLPYLHPTMIVRKSVFNIVGEFNKNYKIAMDFDFIARLVKSGYKGFYVNEKAVVRMEGTGRSVEKEFDAIKECFVSLKNNNLLNITNLNGYIARIILFSLRKAMVVMGLERLLVDLKKRKHS